MYINVCVLNRVLFSSENIYATLPHTERARAMVLNGDPKGRNFLYCNGKHVIMRDINVSRKGVASVNLTMKDVWDIA